MSKNRVYVDGYTDHSNPANSGGFTLVDGKKITDKPIVQKDLTNNQVEIMAIMYALLTTKKDIVSDSQLAINCITGRWKTEEPKLAPLVSFAKVLLEHSPHILIWEPRETNLAGQYNETYHAGQDQRLPFK